MTLAGAKQRLKVGPESVARNSEVLERLKSIRDELEQMRKELDYVT